MIIYYYILLFWLIITKIIIVSILQKTFTCTTLFEHSVYIQNDGVIVITE